MKVTLERRELYIAEKPFAPFAYHIDGHGNRVLCFLWLAIFIWNVPRR